MGFGRRPARIVSVCVSGKPLRKRWQWSARRSLVRQVVSTLLTCDGVHPLDAVLFPAGFAGHRFPIGSLATAQRRAALRTEGFSSTMVRAAKRLAVRSPGVVLVVGSDLLRPKRKRPPEQLCIAFDQRGILAIVAKIFPTGSDTRHARRRMITWLGDYDARARLVTLPNGQRALIAACYDVFGLALRRGRAARLLSNVRAIGDEAGRVAEGAGAELALRKRTAVDLWRATLSSHSPQIVLAAIHMFRRAGREGYWQRHGIAMASAAVSGGLVVGAAHFVEKLPSPNRATLAATGVPRRHLKLGTKRRQHVLLPTRVLSASAGELEALVRVYEARGVRGA
jgi:hypothetical protein